MDGVVGRAAGSEKGDDGVDDRLLVDHPAHTALARTGQFDGSLGRRGCQGIPEAGVRVDEGRRGQVEADHLHHHLVGIGGAVEGAGARRVVAGDLAFQQGGAIHLVLGVEGAHPGLFRVGNAAGHGAGGGEDDRQMAERQRAHEQARHDLVAHAEAQGGVKGIVGQGYCGRHGDHVAAEQRQLHARPALGHAIAHGGRTARDLGGGIRLAHGLPDDVRKALERLMGRQHVVVGGDDAQVRVAARHGGQLVLHRGTGEGVGPVGAAQLGATGPVGRGLVHAAQIVGAGVTAAGDDAIRDRAQGGVEVGHADSSVHRTCRWGMWAARAATGTMAGSPMT